VLVLVLTTLLLLLLLLPARPGSDTDHSRMLLSQLEASEPSSPLPPPSSLLPSTPSQTILCAPPFTHVDRTRPATRLEPVVSVRCLEGGATGGRRKGKDGGSCELRHVGQAKGFDLGGQRRVRGRREGGDNDPSGRLSPLSPFLLTYSRS